MIRWKPLLIAVLAATGLALAACDDGSVAQSSQAQAIQQEGDMSQNTYGYESTFTETNQKHLDTVQPPVKLDSSLERQNLQERLKQLNNPNQVRYFYGLSWDGKILAFYTIKGAVSSVNSLLTDPTQIVTDPYCSNNTYNGGNYACGVQVESPDLNGTYGPNGPDNAVFFFTTSGAMVDWTLPYMVATQPLQLSQPPLITEAVNGKGQAVAK